MRKSLDVRKLLVLALLFVALFTPVTTYAQEEAAAGEPAVAEEAAPPPGLGTLMLLIGVGAVALVGGAMMARDSFKGDSDMQS